MLRSRRDARPPVVSHGSDINGNGRYFDPRRRKEAKHPLTYPTTRDALKRNRENKETVPLCTFRVHALGNRSRCGLRRPITDELETGGFKRTTVILSNGVGHVVTDRAAGDGSDSEEPRNKKLCPIL
ncbi:hypothetical protein EYF80_017433 [Liparis tanakae]|uniref:Uncharacterized protein n=1 Tax=Liparis tanakae TaxID=230148 RepID=A0A4Z2I3D8_9TELE|nr:hypothetical protein EYF80_017433 [Liparis tanakae]